MLWFYMHRVLFIRIEITATAITKTSSRYHRFRNCIPLSISRLNPHVDGKSWPAFSSGSGSIDAGNIMPDNIIEGKNNICCTMVSFDWLLTARPKIHAMLSEVEIYKMRPVKKFKIFDGKAASNIMGAIIIIIQHIMIICSSADMNIDARGMYNGTPLAI